MPSLRSNRSWTSVATLVAVCGAIATTGCAAGILLVLTEQSRESRDRDDRQLRALAAYYQDSDLDGRQSFSDHLLVIFNRDLVIQDPVAARIFDLPPETHLRELTADPDSSRALVVGLGSMVQLRGRFEPEESSRFLRALTLSGSAALRDEETGTPAIRSSVDLETTFVRSRQRLSLAETRCGAAADVNDDGRLDLITCNVGRRNLIYFGDDEDPGEFRGSAFFGQGSADDVCVADFDRDGDLDLLLGHDRGAGPDDVANRLYLNQGDAVFLDEPDWESDERARHGGRRRRRRRPRRLAGLRGRES